MQPEAADSPESAPREEEGEARSPTASVVPEPPKRFKILLIGPAGAGKTSFLTRARQLYSLAGTDVSGLKFPELHIATVGVSVAPLWFQTDLGPVVLDVWDTAGDERHAGLRDGYYVGSDAALVLVDGRAPFIARDWMVGVQRVQESCPCFVVRTKRDLVKPVEDLIEEVYEGSEPVRGVRREFKISAKMSQPADFWGIFMTLIHDLWPEISSLVTPLGKTYQVDTLPSMPGLGAPAQRDPVTPMGFEFDFPSAGSKGGPEASAEARGEDDEVEAGEEEEEEGEKGWEVGSWTLGGSDTATLPLRMAMVDPEERFASLEKKSAEHDAHFRSLLERMTKVEKTLSEIVAALEQKK